MKRDVDTVLTYGRLGRYRSFSKITHPLKRFDWRGVGAHMFCQT